MIKLIETSLLMMHGLTNDCVKSIDCLTWQPLHQNSNRCFFDNEL